MRVLVVSGDSNKVLKVGCGGGSTALRWWWWEQYPGSPPGGAAARSRGEEVGDGGRAGHVAG